MMLRTLPLLILTAFSASASAAAFQLLEQNASGLGTAYAGSAAVAEDASTIYFNPAGMTQLSGRQVSFGVNAVGPSYKFRDNTGASSGGDAGGWSAVPNAYMSWQLAPDFYAGLGISAPFGLSTEYDSNWVGKARAIKSEIRTINYNPALAYRLNDKVSLGAGLNYQTIDAEMTSNPGAPYRVKGDDGSWGWNAGALFTLSPAMRVGISYRSAVSHRLDGTRTLGPGTSPATADIKLPGTFILSVWQQLSDRWEMMGDFSYTRWSSLDQLVIHRTGGTDVENFNYKNSWRLAWGAAYKYTPALKLKFGIAYDHSPVTDTDRSPRVPDNDRLWLSLGGQWSSATYGKIDVGYSYLYVRDPSINQAPVVGKYDAGAHILGAQYSYGF